MTSLRTMIVTTAVALAVLAGSPGDANACSCMPADVASSYNNASDVIRARVLWGVTIGQTRWYIARSLGTFKGCIDKGQWVYLTTASSGAACGAYLQLGKQYLINGHAQSNAGVPVLSINSCDYNLAVGQLTKSDRKFLLTRYNCCGTTCVCTDGSQPVNCFADPCSFADCPSGECVANYCGGCHAEFFDQYGQQVCTPCLSGKDCPWTQLCNQGMCVSQCYSDDDCDQDSWCRQTEDPGVSACAPYAQEGETCGGFTPIWALSKCAPGLDCTDYPPFIADAPGTCRKPCDTNADCAKDQYCSSSGYCRDDGACQAQKDCWAKGNEWVHPACVGYAYCGDGGKCGWECGSPQCPDLKGVDFGPCDAVLGAAVIGGTCQWVSGCSAGGYELYQDLESCKESCGPEPTPSCKDLGGIDFGACQMVLGVAVVGGQCQTVSGCSDQGYQFFDSYEACAKSCINVMPASPRK